MPIPQRCHAAPGIFEADRIAGLPSVVLELTGGETVLMAALHVVLTGIILALVCHPRPFSLLFFALDSHALPAGITATSSCHCRCSSPIPPLISRGGPGSTGPGPHP